MDLKVDYKIYPILYIDDEKGNIIAFESNFEDEFNIISAASAEEGLEILNKNESIAVLIVDQKLGEGKMEGTAMCEIVRREYPDIVRIILTAFNEFKIAFEGINKGNIFKYIFKPWNPHELRLDLERAVNIYASIKERKKFTYNLIELLVNALEDKDKYAVGHSESVTKYATWIAQKSRESDINNKEITAQFLQNIKFAAKLHDVGKIALGDNILSKPGKLTKEEYQEVKKHPLASATIMGLIDDLIQQVLLVRYHHEHWDGQGYPEGLKEEEIPLGSRMLAVADAYDAMTSERSYRNKFTPEEAVKELIRCKGTQFDPILVDAFIEVLMEKGIISKTD